MSQSITVAWAETAEPGLELDMVCARWLGLQLHTHVTFEIGGEDFPVWSAHDPWEYIGEENPGPEFPAGSGTWGPGDGDELPPKFSSEWSAAGPLLEAMSSEDLHTAIDIDGLLDGLIKLRIGQDSSMRQDLRPIDIARACAILEAHGVTREDLD